MDVFSDRTSLPPTTILILDGRQGTAITTSRPDFENGYYIQLTRAHLLSITTPYRQLKHRLSEPSHCPLGPDSLTAPQAPRSAKLAQPQTRSERARTRLPIPSSRTAQPRLRHSRQAHEHHGPSDLSINGPGPL